MNGASLSKNLRSAAFSRVLIAIAFLGLSCLSFILQKSGTLNLTVIDSATNQPTPARVELLDPQGNGYVAEDALPIGGDCVEREAPSNLTMERAIALLSKELHNLYTKTTQFYSVGEALLTLPPGSYKLKVYKGTEYQVQQQEVQIEPGASAALTVRMSRWINLPEQGWYSADDHLHIARPVPDLNPFISKWMQAEDIHVANLLQFGVANRFHNTLQYAHGPRGLYREGDYLLATGQENPRTHFLGHGIILGAASPIHFPEAYVIYRLFWEQARRQGALSGYAHWAIEPKLGGQSGLAIDLPDGLLNFLEVLQQDIGDYSVWYDTLNLGIRLTPTAGTDYPCTPSLPGRERFYTKVRGPLTYKSWLEGVRAGRTFVTNGPALEFRVSDKELGEEVVLEKPGPVLVEARVRFDPGREAVERLEIIENGQLLRSFPRKGEAAEIECRFTHEVQDTSWLAVRAWGRKLAEQAYSPTRALIYSPSVAHSAPIYIQVKGSPGLSAHPRAKALARPWLARLEDLEMRLAEDQIRYLARPGQGLGTDYLLRSRAELLRAIQSAKKYFANLSP